MKISKKIIYVLLIVLIIIGPFIIPYNSSKITSYNIEKDKIVINAVDSDYLKLLEGKENLEQFSLSNNSETIQLSDLTGNNPIHKITTYTEGIPQHYIFNLYGNFEMTHQGGVVFNIKAWENIGNSSICLIDTIYFRYYIALVILLFCGLLGKRYILQRLFDKEI